MEITARIVQNGKVTGVRLQDGALSYPIVLDALANREIYNTLKAAGWMLVGLPLKFRKQGASMDSLPEENFDSLSISDRADYFSYDREDVLTPEQLAAELPEDKEFIPWRQPIYAHITTRQQFLDFLRNSATLKFSSTIPESYCPLNAFCSAEAMFTPDEYFDERNAMYVSLIENRRRLSFEAYQELISLFVGLGMTQSYTAYDFQKFYFSWGICGINTRQLAVLEEDKKHALGQYYASESTNDYSIRVAKDIFIDAEKNVIPALQPGWELSKDFDVKAAKLSENEIAVVTAYKTVKDRQCLLTCEGINLRFNDYRVYYLNMKTGGTRWSAAVQIRYPLSYNFLSVHHYNILNDAGKRHIHNQIIVNALSQELVHSLKVTSDSSSLKALKTLGFTERAAISYIASRLAKLTVMSGTEDGAAIDNEEQSKLDAVRNGLTDYLKGSEDIEGETRGSLNIFDSGEAISMTDVEDFVNDVRSGQINIDSILEGQNNDASASRNFYSSVFYALLDNKLISAESLINQVKAFSLGDENAGFMPIITDNNQVIHVPVSKGDLQAAYFPYDITNYHVRMADEALAWIHVDRVYHEPAVNTRQRHVAVKIYRFNHANIGRNSLSLQNTAIIFPINELLMELVRNLPNAAVRRKVESSINIYIAYAIFEAYTKQSLEIRMPDGLNSQVLYLSSDLLSKINKSMFVQYDSTFAISDHMAIDDNFQYYCNNATIYPDLVVPKQKVMLHSYPFLENWENLRSDPMKVTDYISRYLIPTKTEEPDFTGICNVYRSKYAIDHSDCEQFKELRATGTYVTDGDATQLSPWSLKIYYEYVTKEIKRRAGSRTEQLDNFQMLHEDAFPVSYPTTAGTPCEPANFIEYTPTKKQMLIGDLLLKKWPEFVEMSNVNYFESAESVDKGFISVSSIPSSIFNTVDINVIINLPHRLSERRIKLAARIGDALMFSDKTKILASELPTLSRDVYAYEQLGGYLFVMDTDGVVLARKLSEGVAS